MKIQFFKKQEKPVQRPQAFLAQKSRIIKPTQGREKSAASLKASQATINFPGEYGYSERIALYRFLRENIPIINGAIWVWVRLCSSPLAFRPSGTLSERTQTELMSKITELSGRLAPSAYLKSGGLERLADLFFCSLLVDGAFAGNLELDQSGHLVGFTPADVRNLVFEYDSGWKIYQESAEGRTFLAPSTFIYIPLDDDVCNPRGKSILQSVGFVSRLEQKLLDDMQKSQEKAGYNRLHVLIKKPDRRLGESETNYIDRANQYFDDTVTLFAGIKPADSAVTWDDIDIKAIGPASGSGNATHSWYLSHRALVEDICAGLHLDPFMLGYSYSSTQTWARFKYELVLREIVSIQKLAVRFFEWLINSYLVSSGSRLKAEVYFDNDRIAGALERYKAEHETSERVIDLFKAGLISRDEARERILKNEGAN